MFDFEGVKARLGVLEIPFEVVEFPDEAVSARTEDNSITKNYDPENAIKTLVVEGKKGLVGVIICGSDRLDSKKLKEVIGRWSVVSAEKLGVLGFVVGGINPFCLDFPLLLDKRVCDLKVLSMGAGARDKGVNVGCEFLRKKVEVMVIELAL